MMTLTQLKTLTFDIHWNIVENGLSLYYMWKIERHDGMTTDTFVEFCNDVLCMFNNILNED